ncbi:MAG: hypothetical protein AB7G17_04920 [Phycisphaerales bacterium]
MKSNHALIPCAAIGLSLLALTACEKQPSASTPANTAPAAEQPAAAPGHSGAVIQLGTSTVGPFNVHATRDQGDIIAGKDVPIDLTITPTAGAAAKVTAVRFWIGTHDAKGSVKAKAAIENPAEPDRWHTHAEVPNPIPAGAKLWVEIEHDKGETSTGSFELNR